MCAYPTTFSYPTTTSPGALPLHDHARLGNHEVAKVIIEWSDGPLLSTRSPEGQTALHHYVQGGNEVMAALIIEHGADQDVRDHHGWAPRHVLEAQGTLY